jgi:hypothetical protein
MTERWLDNWRALAPIGAVRIDVGRSAAARRAARETVAGLATGTPVVLCAAAPGAIGRCRRFAAESRVTVDRAYLAFPSAAAPAYLVQDAPESVGAFVERMLAAPPRMRVTAPVDLCLAVLRIVNPWRILRAVTPGLLVVGTRT